MSQQLCTLDKFKQMRVYHNLTLLLLCFQSKTIFLYLSHGIWEVVRVHSIDKSKEKLSIKTFIIDLLEVW